IGEEEIVFYKDKIDINIAVNENEKDNILYSVMEGNQQVSKLNAPITVENKHNTIDNSIIHYYLSFRKSNITNKEVKKIIEEINDYHEKAKLFLKFTVLMDNEIIDYDITEEYKVLVMKTKRDIFSYIQMRLLI
ncbi:MAG: hypothetical protein LBV17_11805, partial [Treponema sp.]|nr:hypothetical protein [Treponema sp.]